MRRRISYILILIVPVFFYSCRATKYVSDEEYLLNSFKIESGDGEFDKKELDNYIKQKPNKKIFFWRFYLSLYNLSNPEKDNGFHNWLRTIGEPPVVFSEMLKEKSTEQLSLFMKNKGYYEAEVSDTTTFSKKRAKVVYRVEPNRPYLIRDITYFFEDGRLGSMLMKDTGQNDFNKGELFDVDVLQKERIRIEKTLRDSGYFDFNKDDYIYFEVDSTLGSYEVDITLGVRNYPARDRLGNSIHTPHPVYRIREVSLDTEYNSLGYGPGSEAEGPMDTVLYDSVSVLYTGKPGIKPGLVTQKNYIFPGSLFDASGWQRTYRNLSALSATKMVDIKFTVVDTTNRLLDCMINVSPAIRQSYTIKLEGTNSAGNIGAAANIGYQHRNLFGGSEQFDLAFMGAIETLQESNDNQNPGNELSLMQEFGVEARIRIPQFLLPFKSDHFIREFNPQTNIRGSYNYQRRPDYTRSMGNVSFGYDWRGSERIVHRVYPVEASLILTPYKSNEFQQWLQGKYLFYSYEPHLIIDSRYSLIWSNKKLLKNQSFQDIRFNVETAGNLLYGGSKWLAEPPSDAAKYQLLGVDFAQYIKTDIDLRSYIFLYEDVSLVLRGFAGVGFAYLNSTAMPFEKQYFSGGANSIRAWQVKALGPGSYDDPDETTYPNQTGDVKLEANMEYRFKLFWKLEAALFLDVGNIWSLSAEDDRVGAGFEFSRFYNELAVGTGVGARAVFSFFIFRFDLGIPLRSPYQIGGSNWLPGNAGISGRDLTLNLAIGYPF